MRVIPTGAFRVANWTSAAIVCFSIAALGACGSNVPPPRQASAAMRARPVSAPQQSRAALPSVPASSHAALWRLRAGLNVAALSCRNRTPVAPAYGRLLSRHRSLLAAAYQAEQRRLGVTAFDREQTRTYNRFANQRSPQDFCRSAAAIAGQAAAMPSTNLVPAARGLASQLESRLR